MAAVAWYRVPGASVIPLGDGTMVGARWDKSPNRIVLAGDSEFAGDLVRHEMLHALLNTHGHPRSVFVGACGGAVVCIASCLSDGGPAPLPDPSAVAVPPTALTLSVAVTLPAGSSAAGGGHVMMVVTATNPSETPLAVQLPPSGDGGPPVSFSYSIESAADSQSYDMRADAVEVTRFAPFEQKRFIFDFRITALDLTRYELAPGTYEFNGAYGRVWATDPPTLTLPP